MESNTRTVCRNAAFDKGLCDALEVARLGAYNHGWVGAHLSNLSKDEAIEPGSKVAALIGLGIDGEEGMEIGAEVGAEQAAEEGVKVFSDEQGWDVLGDIPNDSAAALLLLEHHWRCRSETRSPAPESPIRPRPRALRLCDVTNPVNSWMR